MGIKRFLSSLSLRSRIMILVFLSAAPVLAILLYTASEQRIEGETEARDASLQFVRFASSNVGQLVEGSRQLLAALAELPSLQNQNSAACNAFFSSLKARFPMYGNFVAANTDGDIFCSALPLEKKINVSDRIWFEEAVRTHQFTVGSYQIGRIIGRPVLNGALPVFKDGRLSAVVSTAIDLDWFNEQLGKLKIPEGSSIFVMDRDGTVMARSPDPEHWAGRNASQSGIVKLILTQKSGTVLTSGLTGATRFFSFCPVEGTNGRMFVCLGVSPEMAFAKVRRDLATNMIIWMISVAMLAMIASFAADLFIMRRMKGLTEATDKLANGDLGARTDFETEQDEIGNLSRSFNSMAASLEQSMQRQRELLRQNELILNSAGEGIYGLDTDGNHTFINPAAARMLGYEVAELIGRNSHAVLHHSNTDGSAYPEAECPISKALMDGTGHFEENEIFWRKDGTSFPIRYSVTPIIDNDKVKGVVVSFRDITARKRYETMLLARVHLLDFASTHSLEETMQKTLDEIGEIVNSPIGFYHMVGEDEKTVLLQAWSTRTLSEFCAMHGKGLHYNVEDAGVWVDCIRQRGPIIHNDYISLYYRKGLPDGHAEVTRELVVPIMRSGKIVAIIGVGNKPSLYNESDVDVVGYLADVAWDIIERKRVVDALLESEDRLRFALETSHTGAWDLDLADHTTFRSLEHDRIFGYDRLLPKWTYEMFLEHILPEDREDVDAKFRRAILAESDWNSECRIRRADGEVRWIWAAGCHRTDETGQARRMAGIVQDITERKKAEQQIRDEKDFSAHIINGTPAIICGITGEGTTIFINPAGEMITGYSSEELIGKNWWKVFYPGEEYRQVEQLFVDLKKGEVRDYEMSLTTRSGDKRIISWNSVMTFDEKGKLIQNIGFGNDITERKRAEQAIIKAKEEWERTFASVPDLIAILDTQHRIVQVNNSMARRLGKSREECVGLTCFEAVHGTLNPPVFCPHSAVIKDGLPHSVEIHEDRLGGDFVVTATPLRDDKGRLIGSVHVAHDVTERIRAERALRRTHNELETRVVERTAELMDVNMALDKEINERKNYAERQAQLIIELESINKELNDFAHIISHDLKAPLRAIKSLSEWVLQDHGAELGEGGREKIALLNSRIDHLRGLIDGILEYSKVGRQGMDMVEVDLGVLVNKIIYSLSCPKKIRIAIDCRMPVIKCDLVRIGQVFQNLLDNAIKHMDNEQGEIRISCKEDEDGWIFSIADNGPGIAGKHHERIFQLFQSLFGEGEKKGMGIGLAIVKKIVEMHGGRIWVDSEIGFGSRFFFTIPKIASANMKER